MFSAAADYIINSIADVVAKTALVISAAFMSLGGAQYDLQLAQVSPPSTGLVAHWKFDEASGALSAADSAGSAVGTIKNGANFVSGGKSGNALTLDGVNNFVDLGDPASLKFTSSMTISAWVKLNSIPAQGVPIIDNNGFGGQRSWGLFACGDCLPATNWLFRLSADGTNASVALLESSAPLTTNWTHIIAIYDASARTISMYVNGVLDSGTLSGIVPASQFDSQYGPDIGNRPNELAQSNYFPGLIDDLRVYNRALSVSEASALWDSYQPAEQIGLPSNPNPVNGATGVATGATLSWIAGSGAATHDVYFGTANPPVLVASRISQTSYTPAALTSGITYYWRVAEWGSTSGFTVGPVWSFTVGSPAVTTFTDKQLVSLSKCLHAIGATSGSNVVIQDCNASTNQRWIYTSAKELRNGTLCLDVYGGGNTPAGTNVQVFNCNGGSNQKWDQVGTTWRPENVSEQTMCLDISGGSSVNGTNVQIWNCSGGANQNWLAQNQSIALCRSTTFVSGSVSPPSVSPGGSYTLSCDYGVVTDSINPIVGSGSCTYTNFVGNSARFNCTAGQTVGTFSNSCTLINRLPDNYCARTDNINSLTVSAPVPRSSTIPPLAVSTQNRRYFARSGVPIYLGGVNQLYNIDSGATDPPPSGEAAFTSGLNDMVQYGANMMRLWRWPEFPRFRFDTTSAWDYSAPQPWLRGTTCCTGDGKNKFDLNQYDPVYFTKLRDHVIAANAKGITPHVMLFEGFVMADPVGSVQSWPSHPFRVGNNTNGINGDTNSNGSGLETQQLCSGACPWQTVQDNYVKQVVDTLNDLDVMYEIANEADPSTLSWQDRIANVIYNYESTKPQRHPIGISGTRAFTKSSLLATSPAVSWVSFGLDYAYWSNPTPADGTKVIIADTDHMSLYEGTDRKSIPAVWRFFTRGINISLLIADSSAPDPADPRWAAVQRAVRDVLNYSRRLNLNTAVPRGDLTSTTFALANPGNEYLVYKPAAQTSFTVNLTAGTYTYEWFNIITGAVAGSGSVTAASGNRSFTPPFTGEAALYLKVSASSPIVNIAPGPLAVSTANPRYFTNGLKPIYLTGSHTWTNLQDKGPTPFAWTQYLDILSARHHNFIRLWTWQNSLDNTTPLPWIRSSTCCAIDGGNKWDLAQFNLAFFSRLRQRVQDASSRGMYTSIMLFNGWSAYDAASWGASPFNTSNNVHGYSPAPTRDTIWCSTTAPWFTHQVAYVRRVIDEVNAFDNVLYEIGNEMEVGISATQKNCTEAWTTALINEIKSYEATKAKRHPIGFTDSRQVPGNAYLLQSGATWISPGLETGTYTSNPDEYKGDAGGPPDRAGQKVVIVDSDHLGADSFTRHSVWSNFTRGNQVISMEHDCVNKPGGGCIFDELRQPYTAVRYSMQDTKDYADRLNLAQTTPSTIISSTKYALAEAGNKYLVYQPTGGAAFTVNLSGQSGKTFSVEWFDVVTRTTRQAAVITGGNSAQSFTPPSANPSVLFLQYTGAASDTTPPTVSITAPASGSTVSGTQTITTNSSDNVGVTKVEFFTELGKLGETLTAPFSFAWNTLSPVIPNGSHSITAKAWDAAQNNTTSAPPVSVTVSNAAQPPPTGGANVFQQRFVLLNMDLGNNVTTDTTLNVLQTMGDNGYNGAYVSSAGGNCESVPTPSATCIANRDRVKAKARQLGITLIPQCCGGFEGNRADPNLSEAFPIIGTEFRVSGSTASPVTELSTTNHPNPGFEFWSGTPLEPTSWGINGKPGTVGTLWQQDSVIKHGGSFSLKAVNPGLNALGSPVKNQVSIGTGRGLKPNRMYKLSVWLKTSNWTGAEGAYWQILGPDNWNTNARFPYAPKGGGLSPYTKLTPTQDWTYFWVKFPSTDLSSVYIMLVINSATTNGTLWIDDFELTEIGLDKGVTDSYRPVVVTSLDGLTTYTQGSDYTIPSMNGQSLNIPAGSRITNGSTVRVNWWRLANYTWEYTALSSFCRQGQFDAMAADLQRKMNFWGVSDTKAVMLSFDEMGAFNWDPACGAMSSAMPGQAGRYLAEKVIGPTESMVKSMYPNLHIIMWNDMFDPYHNAKSVRYMSANGSLTTPVGGWEGIHEGTYISNWHNAGTTNNMKFWAGLDNTYVKPRPVSQIIGGFYDTGSLSLDTKWRDLLAQAQQEGVSNVTGYIYQSYSYPQNFNRLKETADLWKAAGRWGTGPAFTGTPPPPPTDTTPPTVSISAPASGVTVSGTQTITTNLSDNIGVTKVEFFTELGKLGETLTAPFSFAWNTLSPVIPNGSHSITAKAWDAAQNNTTSNPPVSVTVNNSIFGGITYYISPTGNDTNTGTSPATPKKTFSQYFNTSKPLKAGDTLVLLDGTYTKGTTGFPQIDCTTNANNGTSVALVTIRADHERQALLQSDGTQLPFSLRNCTRYYIDGISTRNADNATATQLTGGSLSLYNITDTVLHRVLVAHANQICSANGGTQCNDSNLTIENSQRVLVEEVEVWDYHRHGITVWKSEDVIVRRCYLNARDDIGTSKPGDESIAFYNSSHGVVENCIGEGGSGWQVHGGTTAFNTPGGQNNWFVGSIMLNSGAQGGKIDHRMAGSNPWQVNPAKNNTYEHDVVVGGPTTAASFGGISQQGGVNTAFRNVTVLNRRSGGDGINIQDITDGYTGTVCSDSASIGEPCSWSAINTVVANGTGYGISTSGAASGSCSLTNVWSANNTSGNFNSIAHCAQTNMAQTVPIGIGVGAGQCVAWAPSTSNLIGAGTGGTWNTGASKANIGATILYRYETPFSSSAPVLTAKPLWDTTTGAFPCGAVLAGINDYTNRCNNVQNRLNINTNGCAFPANYNIAASASLTLTSGPTASNITTSGATISWSLSAGATGVIDYGLTSTYGQSTPAENSYTWSTHSQNIPGPNPSLQPNTTYHYRIRSTDAAGNSVTSPDRTFTTLSLVGSTDWFSTNSLFKNRILTTGVVYETGACSHNAAISCTMDADCGGTEPYKTSGWTRFCKGRTANFFKGAGGTNGSGIGTNVSTGVKSSVYMSLGFPLHEATAATAPLETIKCRGTTDITCAAFKRGFGVTQGACYGGTNPGVACLSNSQCQPTGTGQCQYSTTMRMPSTMRVTDLEGTWVVTQNTGQCVDDTTRLAVSKPGFGVGRCARGNETEVCPANSHCIYNPNKVVGRGDKHTGVWLSDTGQLFQSYQGFRWDTAGQFYTLNMDSGYTYAGVVNTTGNGFENTWPSFGYSYSHGTALGHGGNLLGIRESELAAGRINHMLAMVVSSSPCRSDWLAPAVAGAANQEFCSDINGSPIGTRVQLDPALNCDDPAMNLKPDARTICRALQEYGAIISDWSGANGAGAGIEFNQEIAPYHTVSTINGRPAVETAGIYRRNGWKPISGDCGDTSCRTGIPIAYLKVIKSSGSLCSYANPGACWTALPPTTLTLTSGPTASNITQTGATISWALSAGATGVVDYGLTSTYGQSTTAENSYTWSAHSQNIPGPNPSLQPNTTYHYRIRSTDASGNSVTSTDRTFTTASAPVVLDTTAPVFSNITATNITTNSATILWTTDEQATSQVGYGTGGAFSNTSSLDSTLVTSHSTLITGLAPNSTYNYRVISGDAAGNIATSLNRTFQTQSSPDTQKPNTITNLSAGGTTQVSTNLSWTSPSDPPSGSSIVSYDIRYSPPAGGPLSESNWSASSQVTGEPSPSAPGTVQTYTLVGLSPSTTYYIGIKSIDAVGNISLISNIVQQTTQSPPAAFDFSISDGGDRAVVQGNQVVNTITATLLSGTAQAITFSASGLPTGATATFLPTTCNPNCSTTLTITTIATTPASNSTITITGTAGATVHTAIFMLTVSATPPAFDFLLSSGGNRSINQGSSITNTVTASISSGTTRAVSYTVSGLPTGVTTTFSPTNCNPNCSTTLAITAGTATPVGASTVTITGTSGGLTRTTQFTLTVTVPPDITAPVRSSAAPTGTLAAGTTNATLSLTTNENSTCKYSTTPNTVYASMATTFTTTGALAHSSSLSNLTNSTSYNYYVRCQDTAGNVNTSDYAITFSVATSPPPASNDFTLTTGGAVSVIQGGQTAKTITATLSSGSTQAVTFSSSGLPAGATASFSPTTCSPNCSTTLTISAGAATPIGNSTITVTGTGPSAQKSATFNLMVNALTDTTAPVLSAGAPSGILAAGTTNATLSLTTNENAACRYSTTRGTTYASMMRIFVTTGALNHSSNLSGLANSNSYNYYVRCQDMAGNINTSDYVITFSVNSASPTTFDFTLANAGNASVQKGGSVSNTISTTLVSGTAEPITFAVSGLPADTTASFSPATCISPCSSTITLQTQNSTPTGDFTITVATSGKTTTFMLKVTAQATQTAGSGGGGGGGGGGGFYDSTPPAKPGNLRIFGGPDQIILDWSNPTDTDFVRVALIRKEGSTPASVADGTRIYDGTDTEFTDTKIEKGKTYYYALFAFDQNVNYSQPATGFSYLGKNTEAEIIAQRAVKPPPAGGQTSLPDAQTQCAITQTDGITITRSLYIGAPRGEDIRTLQAYLKKLGYFPPNEETTTFFGFITREAIRKFQCARLNVCSGTESSTGYGSIGPKTRKALSASSTLCPTPPAGGSTAQPTTGVSITRWLIVGSTGEDVKALQQFLKQNGYFPQEQEVTIYFGSITQGALRKFQCARLNVCSGTPDSTGYGATGPRTRAALR